MEEVLEPSVCAVVVVDVQNDAMRPDGKLAEANDVSAMVELLPHCASFIAAARSLGIRVVHIQTLTLRDGSSDSPAWLRAKADITAQTDWFLEGSWGAEICEECAPLDGELVVTKHRSSAFHGTDLEMLLRSNGVETVVIIGEQTPGCIDATLRDATYHDFYAVLVEDRVAAFSSELHDAMLKVQKARNDVCTADEVLAIWRHHAEAAAS